MYDVQRAEHEAYEASMAGTTEHSRTIEALRWSAPADPAECACHGRGWLLSPYDTWERCGQHFNGQQDPESAVQDALDDEQRREELLTATSFFDEEDYRASALYLRETEALAALVPVSYVPPARTKRQPVRARHTCRKCGGSGHIAHFSHVEGGRCFACRPR